MQMESSVFSPTKPDKAGLIAQDSPGINSPSLVFRSPRINQNNQPSFLRRLQFASLSDAGFSGQHEHFEANVTVAEHSWTAHQMQDFLDSMSILRISKGHLSSGLRGTCPEKAFVTNNLLPEKASSPSGFADNCSTEIVIMVDGDSAFSANMTSKDAGDIFHSQTDLLDFKESVDDKEDKDDCINDLMVPSPVITVQAEEDDHKT